MDVGRSKNFSSVERQVLTNLVEKYQDKVLSKDSKQSAINEKNKAWDEITIEFNTEVEVKRTSKQLKAAWHNMKERSKEKFRAQRLEVLKTGGSPPPPDSPTNEKIRNLLKDQIESNGDPHDNNSLLDSPILEVLGGNRNRFTIPDGTCAYTIKVENFAAVEPVDQCHATIEQQNIIRQETQQSGQGVEEKRLVSTDEKLLSLAASELEAKTLYYHEKRKYLQRKEERAAVLYAKKMKLTELLIK